MNETFFLWLNKSCWTLWPFENLVQQGHLTMRESLTSIFDITILYIWGITLYYLSKNCKIGPIKCKFYFSICDQCNFKKPANFSITEIKVNKCFHERVSWKCTACSGWQKIKMQSHTKKPQPERNHAFLKRYLILIDDILLLEFGSSILMTHYVFKYINYIINNLYHYNVLWFNAFKTVSDRWGSTCLTHLN